jgi:hypothetical protein
MPPWWNPLDVDNACAWEGITCSESVPGTLYIQFVYDFQFPSFMRVADKARCQSTIHLDENVWNQTLTGTLPDTFHNLTNLLKLEMHSHRVSGTIPPSLISTHTTIQEIEIKDGLLIGSIPTQLSPTLRKLFALVLSPERIVCTYSHSADN